MFLEERIEHLDYDGRIAKFRQRAPDVPQALVFAAVASMEQERARFLDVLTGFVDGFFGIALLRELAAGVIDLLRSHAFDAFGDRLVFP